MKVARSADDLQAVLNASRVGFKLEQVEARRASDWQLEKGALQHRSRGFFSVNGAVADERTLVLLYQPQAAVTGLITALIDGEPHFLLQARAEPGCLGEAQFGPTVQSTPANFMRLHGGRSTAYVEHFVSYEAGTSVVDDTTQLDLGERYAFKTKRSMLVSCENAPDDEAAFVWANGESLRQAVLKSAFLNIDLRSILAVSEWSDNAEGFGLSARSEKVRVSLAAPVREDEIGKVMRLLTQPRPHSLRFVPLDNVPNWQADDWGWHERDRRQGFEIAFFQVAAAHREVATWIQPLVNSLSDGEVALACRERSGVLEVFVRIADETGFAGSRALAPSFVRYPGEETAQPDWLSGAKSEVTSTIESDEGGRFYRDASRYRIVRTESDCGSGGVWLRLSELKAMLRLSCVCTIQLRGIFSQMLAASF